MKTLREEAFGKAIVRLVQAPAGYAGIVIRDGVASKPLHGEDATALWLELIEDLDRSSVSYFGFDGARARFSRLFPEGFKGAPYRSHERDYKQRASEQLRANVPLEVAAEATSAECDLIAKVYSRTNLLAAVEQARTREVLKSEHGPGFVRGAAAVAMGDVGAGLAAMQSAMKPFGQPSWPAATYLPYLWRPESEMFLKPRVTVDFAERVGHSFARDYASTFTEPVYRSLLSLVADTRREIESLSPADNIDVQSFIWIIGAYDENGVVEVV